MSSTLQKPSKPEKPLPADFCISEADVARIEIERNSFAKRNAELMYWVKIAIPVVLYFFAVWFATFVAIEIIGNEGFSALVVIVGFAIMCVKIRNLDPGDRTQKANPLEEKYDEYMKSLSNYYAEETNYELELKRQEREIRKQQEREEKERKRRDYEYWSSINPYEFEKEIAVLFERCGFQAQVTKGSGDGGIDIILMRGRKTGIVQCKRQKTKVSPGVLRDLYGTMAHGKYDFAFVVCPASFSQKSFEFSKGKNIGLIGLKRIMEMVNQEGSLGFLNIAER